MKIEHWDAQSSHPEQSLQWSNLLGVCQGGAPGAPGMSDDTSEQHCDTLRGNRSLYLHPVEGLGGDPRQHLRYSAAGEVRADDPRAALDVKTLGLNATKLRNARAEVYDQLLRDLKRRGFTAGELRRLETRHQIQPGVPAPPHAEFVLYHLAKKRRASANR